MENWRLEKRKLSIAIGNSFIVASLLRVRWYCNKWLWYNAKDHKIETRSTMRCKDRATLKWSLQPSYTLSSFFRTRKINFPDQPSNEHRKQWQRARISFNFFRCSSRQLWKLRKNRRVTRESDAVFFEDCNRQCYTTKNHFIIIFIILQKKYIWYIFSSILL